MEQIYTIPVNEAFERSQRDPSCGCPLCTAYNRLEDNELDIILGASMMEPDIRIKTNEEGFCRTHYDMMFVRQNRLGMALTLESHLIELQEDFKESKLFPSNGTKPIKRIEKLESSCYVCRRISFNFEHMADTIVYLFDKDEEFKEKFKAQPYFCLPHARKLLEYGQKRLSKARLKEFAGTVEEIENKYLATLKEDISWFCKKFDYRYNDEPWYNSKDSVERAIKFLRSDIHQKERDTKK